MGIENEEEEIEEMETERYDVPFEVILFIFYSLVLGMITYIVLRTQPREVIKGNISSDFSDDRVVSGLRIVDSNSDHKHSPARINKVVSRHPNVDFYRNEIRSRPNGEYIEIMLTRWKGDYRLLERNHFYIQWLFPNRKGGVNLHAHTLKDEEVQTIKNTPELRNRVRRAFEMMLDFYGMSLKGHNQFELTEDYKERLAELNQWLNHNFLRISRILLALKELGHKELMLPWMKFFADLIYEKKYLDMAEFSFERFWFQTLDAEDIIKLKMYRDELVKNQRLPKKLPKVERPANINITVVTNSEYREFIGPQRQPNPVTVHPIPKTHSKSALHRNPYSNPETSSVIQSSQSVHPKPLLQLNPPQHQLYPDAINPIPKTHSKSALHRNPHSNPKTSSVIQSSQSVHLKPLLQLNPPQHQLYPDAINPIPKTHSKSALHHNPHSNPKTSSVIQSNQLLRPKSSVQEQRKRAGYASFP